MRLAYFHTNTVLSSWSIWGAANVLRRMGHEVFDAPIPTDARGVVVRQVTPPELARIARQLPSLTDLAACDRIIVQGPEYVSPWLRTLYDDQWYKLSPRRVGLFLESSARGDAQLPIAQLAKDYDLCFFPDLADAERQGGLCTRPSIDTTVFCPDARTPKAYAAGFVGTLYPKRVAFLQRLAPLLEGIPFVAGSVHAHDLGGECHALWTELYVRNLRQLRIHVALPSNNPMPVSRPFETLACGTFLLESSTLPEPLADQKHYRRYDPDDPAALAELIRYYLTHEDEREAIARAGCEAMRREFAAERAWEELLAA